MIRQNDQNVKRIQENFEFIFLYDQIFGPRDLTIIIMTGSEKIDLLQLDMVNAKTADVEERPRSDFSMKQVDSHDSNCEC